MGYRDMKIMIISDTHKEKRNFYRVLEREGKIDMLVHCGDLSEDETVFQEMVGCPVEAVAGNMDFCSRLPGEKVFQIAGYKVFLTHGHLYGAHFDDTELIRAGEAEGADIVMYGHIHCPVLKKRENMVILNPGSISFPRQQDRRPSYAIMNIDTEGKATYEIKYL